MDKVARSLLNGDLGGGDVIGGAVGRARTGNWEGAYAVAVSSA